MRSTYYTTYIFLWESKQLDDRGSIPGRCREFFSSLPNADLFWGPPSLLSNGYRDLFSWGYSGRYVKLTTQRQSSAEVKNEWRCTSTPS
jgi:hypothetical protein